MTKNIRKAPNHRYCKQEKTSQCWEKITHNIIPHIKKIPLWWGKILIQNPFYIKMLIIWFLFHSKTDILILENRKGGKKHERIVV